MLIMTTNLERALVSPAVQLPLPSPLHSPEWQPNTSPLLRPPLLPPLNLPWWACSLLPWNNRSNQKELANNSTTTWMSASHCPGSCPCFQSQSPHTHPSWFISYLPDSSFLSPSQEHISLQNSGEALAQPLDLTLPCLYSFFGDLIQSSRWTTYSQQLPDAKVLNPNA